MSSIARLLKENRRFLLLTHKDPDADGIGSMLAMAKALQNAEKEVVLFTERPVLAPVNLLQGSEKIIQDFAPKNGEIDVTIVLDCGDKDRVGGREEHLIRCRPVINIDHHEVHDLFGDYNLVDPKSSSTGELVYRVIKEAGFPIDADVAENILAAIQTDTGSFRYDNTTSASFRIAAEMMEMGASPRQIFLKMTEEYSLPRIKLLEMALGVMEFYKEGRIGMVTLSAEMFEKCKAQPEDSDKFVDYLRSVSGVEMAVLVRETGKDCYKFSMRSNSTVNVARLACLFGGGGHAKAAGFECHRSIGALKKDFLKEAGRLLGDISN